MNIITTAIGGYFLFFQKEDFDNYLLAVANPVVKIYHSISISGAT